MTTGSAAKKIIMFSLPLLIGTVFQQLYNMVDSIIVGQYVGTEAFAAVGCTGSITFFVFGLVFGACSGFAIPVAQDFGAGDMDGVRRCVINIIIIGVVFATVVTLATTLLTRNILVWMGTQPEILDDACDYLFWMFAGLSALMLYNLLAGILRSLGDSRTPLYFLILASILNIVLDVLLVKTFAIGVKGASIATVIAQLVSGVLCLIYIIRKFPILHFTREQFRPHMPTIKRLLGIGIPMGLQFSITAIGAIIMQTSVNALGVTVVAAISAAGRVHNLVAAPLDAFGVSVATFAGQNYGAGKIDRVRKGMWLVLSMLVGYTVLAFLFNCLATDKVALLFISAEETHIIAYMKQYLIVMGAFYPMLAVIFAIRNTLQGVGYSTAAMMPGFAELVARMLLGLLVIPVFGFNAVCFANPIAWISADLMLVPMYIVLMKRLRPMKQTTA